MRYKAGDKVRFSRIDEDVYYITEGKVYELYEDDDGWLWLEDDDGDKAYFTNSRGEFRSWNEDCTISIVTDSNHVMIDAEELLEQIDGGTRYNMTVEEVIAYLRGFIRANKGGQR
ncbi:hypothetical protein GH849_32005 [Bacillus thuringiensis]|nr:hypothetical protein [Bacillus thuringiensis]MRB55697.1 hypothetical protein [Bacillus thuringiensis]MRB84906.1 hypothetical protein [Bacillus thuringiensis]MRC26272.1 hypothetical protein [Bacillus thuringiensis]